MNEARLLMQAYWEALYERLEGAVDLLGSRMEQLLVEEIDKQSFGEFDDEKLAAYLEACAAFVEERLEGYNPVGMGYLFDQSRTREAFEMELILDWYDSRGEYAALVKAVREKARVGMSDEVLRERASQLIKERGAYPDQSIIAAYESGPEPNKLPDYVVARAIEEQIGATA